MLKPTFNKFLFFTLNDGSTKRGQAKELDIYPSINNWKFIDMDNSQIYSPEEVKNWYYLERESKPLADFNFEEVKEVLRYALSRGYKIECGESELGYTNNLSLKWKLLDKYILNYSDIFDENGNFQYHHIYSDEIVVDWTLISEEEWIPFFHKEFNRPFLYLSTFNDFKREMEEEQNLQLEERD